MDSTHESDAGPERGGGFATTHWSQVLHASDASSTQGRSALEGLCGAYWYPLYLYARRQGRSAVEAEDLTQDFFVRLLQKGYLSRANPLRGRFRTFLLTALKRFLINDWERGGAAKRGKGQTAFSLDEQDPEARFLAEPADLSTPEKAFEKRWAVTVLEQVLENLRDEFAARGKAAQFEQLKLVLWGEKESPSYALVAAELGLTEGALKAAVRRLRQRYRELLRSEVARTVAGPMDVDDELRHLITVMSG